MNRTKLQRFNVIAVNVSIGIERIHLNVFGEVCRKARKAHQYINTFDIHTF